MDRRAPLTLVAVTALAGLLGPGAAYAQDTVKIGVVGPRTGVMASGAAVTHFPNFKLWEQRDQRSRRAQAEEPASARSS